MKYLFKGQPKLVVIDKSTRRGLFQFDEKGEYITDDPYIIGKAYGHFDNVILKEEENKQEEVEQNEKISNKENITDMETKQEEFKCEKCGKVCKSKLGLIAHMQLCKGVGE